MCAGGCCFLRRARPFAEFRHAAKNELGCAIENNNETFAALKQTSFAVPRGWEHVC
jgi:hypothetical protein